MSYVLTDCTGIAGEGFHDPVFIPGEDHKPAGSKCPASSDAFELSYLGWNVEQDPQKNASRMIYRAEVSEYFNGLKSIEPPNSCPKYTSSLSIYYNQETFIAGLSALTDPPAPKRAYWLLDKEEIIPYQEQGTDNLEHRLTYISEGPWVVKKWNASLPDAGGSGFVVGAGFDIGEWNYDSIMVTSQTKPGITEDPNIPLSWFQDPTGPQSINIFETGQTKQKTMKIQIRNYISGITSLTSPTCQIPVLALNTTIFAHGNGDSLLEIFPIDEISVSDRVFTLSGESLTPYQNKGGEMILWTQEYTYQSNPFLYNTIY